MNKSLHIGINQVDPNAYGGWDGKLQGCHNDALAMAAIAQANGYEPSIMLDEEAKSKSILDALLVFSQDTTYGDTVLITYSGHGGQLYDTTGDESDRLDETWVAFDGMIPDDNIYQALSKFKKGVRVIVISDSCHSGSIVKAIESLSTGKVFQPKQAPKSACVYSSKKAREMFPEKGTRKRILATVVQISGCADSQVSYDGAANGLFTEKLLDAYQEGKSLYGYTAFKNAIVKKLNFVQTPQILYMGAVDKEFRSGKVFSTK